MTDRPIPQPCHQCGHPYAGTVCPLCKEERPAWTAIKNLTNQKEKRMEHEIPFDEKTTEVLDNAIDALGGGAKVRAVVKSIYAIGRIDGGLALIDKQRAGAVAALAIAQAAS